MSRWPTAPIRRVARLGTGHTPSRQHAEYWADCDTPWFTLADVGQLRDGTVSVVSETQEMVSALGIANSSAEIHPAGTVILSRTASVGFSCILGNPMATSQDFATWTCGPLVRPRFLLYSLRGQPGEIESRKTGSTHKTIYMPDIETLRTPLPPLADQDLISRYLDGETHRIDALVEKKRRMVKLFEERRQGAIDSVLTGSGRLVRVRHLTSRITSGPRGWSERESDDGILFLRIANVDTSDIELNMSNIVRVQAPEGAERERTRVHAGDVLVSITAEIGSVGVARVEHDGAAVSQHIALMTPTRCHGDWLALSLCTSRAKSQLEASRYGGTKTQLSLDDVGNTVVDVVSPVDEIRAVTELNERLAQIRKATELLGDQIELLREHRQALITAAVTGAIDIPGLAA